MRRISIALLIAAMALNLAACKKREKPIDPVSEQIIEKAAKQAFEIEGGTPRSKTVPLTEEERQRIATIDLWDSSISDLRPLLRYSNLTHLRVGYCPRLEDLTPLKSLPNVRILEMNNCPGVTDIRPLLDMPRLFLLRVWTCTGVEEIPRAFFKKPGMQIDWKRAATPTPAPTPSDAPAV